MIILIVFVALSSTALAVCCNLAVFSLDRQIKKAVPVLMTSRDLHRLECDKRILANTKRWARRLTIIAAISMCLLGLLILSPN